MRRRLSSGSASTQALLCLSSGLALLACLGACSPLQQSAPQAETVADEPRAVEIHGLPFFPQERRQCGPAALATVLGYRGVDVTPTDLEGRVYVPGRGGSLQFEMVAQTRQFGLLAYPLAASIDDLISELRADNPVLVLQNLGLAWWPQWHYAVVSGFDPDEQTVLLRSGRRARYAMPLAQFEKTWRRAEYWAVVVVPPNQPPATAEPLRYLRSASELEQVGQLDAAREAYRSALAYWPESSAARLGLGNSEYALEHYESASQQFARLVEQQPRLAGGWNNLAHAMLAMGCTEAAQSAASCAVELTADASELARSYRDTLAAAQLQPASGDLASICSIPDCP